MKNSYDTLKAEHELTIQKMQETQDENEQKIVELSITNSKMTQAQGVEKQEMIEQYQ